MLLSAKEDHAIPADRPVVIKKQSNERKNSERNYTHFIALPITNPQTRDRLRFLREYVIYLFIRCGDIAFFVSFSAC